jgi:hypothetical protein
MGGEILLASNYSLSFDFEFSYLNSLQVYLFSFFLTHTNNFIFFVQIWKLSFDNNYTFN